MCVIKVGQPIWIAGKEKGMNITAGLRACFELCSYKHVVLKVATSGVYKCYVNGVFIGFGPARAAKGFFRIDEWDITEALDTGVNIVALEVAGYNVNSFYVMDQPSFIQAEIIADGEIIAATNSHGFELFTLEQKLQRVERYSFQRTFTEMYQLNEVHDAWRGDWNLQICKEQVQLVQGGRLIQRRAPYPRFDIKAPLKIISEGKIEFIKPEQYWTSRFISNINEQFKGFKQNEVEQPLSRQLCEMKTQYTAKSNGSLSHSEWGKLSENQFKIFEFDINDTGFIGMQVSCKENVKLYFVFDEVLRDDDIDFTRLDCINGVCFALAPGAYKLETFEPYTFKYLKIIAVGGDCLIGKVYLREFTNPDCHEAAFACNDEHLNRIFDAGRETFKQNAVDLYTDCPSRERAGWLCDSYFTGRVEKWLCGGSIVEKSFLENYMLAEGFDCLPEGMLPMCYPADFYNGEFIPNWALWFVLELEEYLQRTGDFELARMLKQRVYKLFDYFKDYKNEDGLLESLDSWVFVEWSKANEFVQDVNYPTNMLYAHALEVAGRIYSEQAFYEEGATLKKTIREQSFNGEYFVDNAVRRNGQLVVTNNSSEVCQYLAFYFNIADSNSNTKLLNTLIQDFGPGRQETGKYEHIHPANAFIGNYIRLELLSRYGQKQRVVDELKGFFSYMVDKTGTLWEHDGDHASCNHGFASHVVHTLYKDVLGIESVDTEKKAISIYIGKTSVGYCSGVVPLEGEKLALAWKKEKDRLFYSVKLPKGYSFEFSAEEEFELVPVKAEGSEWQQVI
jgi:alpha-L-rhamnosidase